MGRVVIFDNEYPVPDDPTPPPNGNHSVALWAGLTTLFTNLAAIHVIALLGNESSERSKAIAAVITSAAVAASVYARQRWTDAKSERDRHTPNQ